MTTTAIPLSAEQIDEFVRKTLIETAIGRTIQDEIKRALSADRYDSPITNAVKVAVRKIVEEVLATPEYQEILREAVKEAMTAELVDRVTRETASRMLNG